MEFEEYLKYKFFKNLLIPITHFNEAMLVDGKFICERFQIQISHGDLIQCISTTHKQVLMDSIIQRLHKTLIQKNVQSISEQSFKVKNKIPARAYTISVDAYVFNNQLAPGGIFYEIGEYGNAFITSKSKSKNNYE